MWLLLRLRLPIADYYIYLEAAKIATDKKGRLFAASTDTGKHTDLPMHRNNVICMIKRRGRGIVVPPSICCHTFRATGITADSENGGTIEKAQVIVAAVSERCGR
jgi:integrase/recombinase XerD